MTERKTPPHLAPEYRRSGIGASEIGAILGLSKWRTPLDVYAEKLGYTEPQPDNPALRWGRILEPAVASAYAEARGVELVPGEHLRREFDGCPFLLTPDYLSEEEGLVVEIKTAGSHMAREWGQTGEDGAPRNYAAQLVLYLWGVGLSGGVIAALIGGSDYREYPQARDEELELALLTAGAKFWRDHVLAKNPPAAQNTSDEAKWIERRWRENTSATVLVATPEQADALGQLDRLRAELKELGAREEELENLLKAAIADATGLSSGEFVAKWSLSKGSRPNLPKEIDLDAVAFELNLPVAGLVETIRKHTAERPGSRRFTFNPVKSK
ncbi:MAG: YqaJ viral recombinase family protein [Candidatus Eisenbacteria bacterium]|nr:YqaJ viral recombinase family protein [Candidatus Eisenbacteria bacterium]